MNPNKDYYRILGILEDAEDIVIKAAYKALAQKYHPDKFQGDAKHAKQRMQEINEAYAILSDVTARQKYDGERGKPEYEDDSNEDAEDLLHTLDKDWSDATEYFPDLVGIAFKLSKFSKQLEYTFKVIVIEKKDFNNRFQLAKKLKENYLEKYFGTNKEVHEFAEKMFQFDRRDILQKLNRAVNLLGSEIDPKVIINKLYSDMESQKPEPDDVKPQESKGYSREPYAARFYAEKLIGINYFSIFNMQTHIAWAIEFLNSRGIAVRQTGFILKKYVFEIRGERYELPSSEFISFSIAKANEFMSKGTT
jgi:curved DNA-binding protein CbpA